jgi:glycosyltransferase involved in cell wall biosynthesis
MDKEMIKDKQIKASLVIPTRDKITHLKIVLESFSRQITNEVEVIIIFDGCSEDTLNEFGNLKLCYKPEVIISKNNVGRAVARNLGIDKAQGDIIILSDDDVIPGTDFIQRHIEGHKDHCVLLGEVKYLDYSNEDIELLAKLPYSDIDYKKLEKDAIKKGLTALRRFYRPIWDRILKPISFLTTNVSIEKKDLIQIGMFDVNFKGWGYEDVDLGYRLGTEKIKFKRDFKEVNYHINHPVNKKEKGMEAGITLNYFLSKIKDDKFSQLVLRSYFRAAKILGKFQ